MSSFNLNIGILENCPELAKVAELLENYGAPEKSEWAALAHTETENVLYGQLVYRGSTSLEQFDDECGEVVTRGYEKAAVIPFGLFRERGAIETYCNGNKSIGLVANFLSSALNLSIAYTEIQMDIYTVLQILQNAQLDSFKLKSARVSDYAANSYMIGAYTPRFCDTANGMEFVEKYRAAVDSAMVQFKPAHASATITLKPFAAFKYSVKNEDDKPLVQAVIRKLISPVLAGRNS